MAEVSNNNIQQLFTSGLDREAFIKRYKEIQANAQDTDIIIFTNELDDNIIGAMYDSFHNEASDVTTADDIQKLANFDGDSSSISNDDIIQLYENTLKKLTEVQSSDTNCIDNSNLAIELLNQLKEIKKYKAEKDKNSIRAEIDELIGNNKNINEKLKNEYKSVQENIKNAEKQATNKQHEIKNINKEIEIVNKSITEKQEEIENNPDDENNIKNELKNLSGKSSLYVQNSVKLQNELANINKTIPQYNKKLNQITNKIEASDKDLAKTIKQKQEKIDRIDEDLKTELDIIDKQIEMYEDDLIDDYATLNANNSFVATNGYRTGTRYNGVSGSFNAGSIDFNKNNNAINFNSFAAKGLKYSSAKGQKLAKDVANHSVGFVGHCSRHVRTSLQRTGLYNGHTASAYQMGNVLANNKNFQEISPNDVDLDKLPAGCILVYDKGAKFTKANGQQGNYNSQHGHIEVTLGDKTACSDGRTRSIKRSQNMRIFVPVENA